MRQTAGTSALIAAVTAAGALFLVFEIRTALSPFLIYAVLAFLLHPLRTNPMIDRLFWGVTILFGAWVFSELSGLLTPFLIALVLAYLFEPLMNALLARKIPRVLSALLITFFGVGGIVLVGVLLTPEITRQIAAIGALIPLLPDYFERFLSWIFSFDVFSWLSLDVESVKLRVLTALNEQLNNIGVLVTNFTQTLWKSIPKVITTITTIILLPFLTFWFLNDFNRFSDTVSRILDKKPASGVRKYITMAGGIFNQYIRGQLIVMLIEMTLYSTIFSIIGINYSLLLGLLSGAALWLPYIGISTAIALTSLVISLGTNPAEQFLWAGLTYLSIQVLEVFFMVPKIVGGKVQLNPIILFLSIFSFGYFFGIAGILISIPVSAFLIALVREQLYPENASIIEQSPPAAGRSRP
ncbi:AI-2E family transporter [Prosthecochloris sp. ZM_2]|uniref:AI-2E family transporter n=1 Tax=Prosthecochloris sp. ZM_2 TaxID=2045206 RepID=UPI000DF847C7|nr:AI-2E family transporter [Prosthecochloris sp. ZM_2]RNA65087.1 AI-2E family transporter [Prosthecochloris sp. ZM_2]